MLIAVTLPITLLACGQFSNPPVTYTTFIYAAPQACPALEVSRPVGGIITGKTTPEIIVLSKSGSAGAYRGRFPETYAWDLKTGTPRQFWVSCPEQPTIQREVQILIPDRSDGKNAEYAGHVVTITDDASEPGNLGFSIAGYQ